MKLSVIVLAKDEEKMIKDCLESVKWADEIILVDSGSTDKTPQIAKQYKAKIVDIFSKKLEYSRWRNEGLKAAKGRWILYVDADERVTPELKKEIQKIIASKKVNNSTERRIIEANEVPKYNTAYAIPRRNFLLRKELHWGGWWPAYVKRLFLRGEFKKWTGELHEEPVFKGVMGKLKNPFIHLQPESIGPMFEKSIKWSRIEAKLLHKANHPPVTWWRVLRMGATTLFERLIRKQAFRDGTEGWIMSIYQSFHTMIIYIQLWERQQKKPASRDSYGMER